MNLATPRFGRLLLTGVSAMLLWLASSLLSAVWADPPGRVARLADVTGSVWLFSPDAGEWITANRNRPLTTGDRLSTDADARAELRVGSAVLRLDSGTELEVLRLDDERMAFQLHSGAVYARLSDREAVGEFELTTGEGKVSLRRTGRYRFDRIDGTSHVSVESGEAQIEAPRSATTVMSGQRIEYWLDARNAGQYSLIEPRQDAFAAWNSEQDRRDDRSASARYVSPEMTGIEDLDRHGRWQQTPDYGALWVPRTVPQGWSPYGFGHWAWITPWGWTWVDDAPWGFAPFHYGRWVQHRGDWAWAPGSYVRRPVYAPALVAWVGGPRLSVSISIGAGSPAPTVGWFPLAPREVYVPGYRVTPRYVREVNITHVTNITNVTTIINNPQTVVNQTRYRHRGSPGAVVVAPQSVLVGRQPVAPIAKRWRDSEGGRVAISELAQAPLGNALLAPARSVTSAPPTERRGSDLGGNERRVRSDRSDRPERQELPARPERAVPIAGTLSASPLLAPAAGVPVAAAPEAPAALPEARRAFGSARFGNEPDSSPGRGLRGGSADDGREAPPRTVFRQRPVETRAEPGMVREPAQAAAQAVAALPSQLTVAPGTGSGRVAAPEKVMEIPRSFEKAAEKASEKVPEKGSGKAHEQATDRAGMRAKPPRDESATKQERRQDQRQERRGDPRER